jgi:SAM-dependent methyltransferase
MTIRRMMRFGGLTTALIGRVAPRPKRLPAREAYALWADSYPPWPHNPLMQAEQDVVAPIIASISPLRALDVGTGSGRYLPMLAATGARLVVGVDFSLPMLTRKSGLAADGVRVCGDACRLPFGDATFDLASASLMVGDVADLSGWIGEMARVLVPGGHLIYSDFHPTWAPAGWRRTFQAADGRSIEVPYFSHTVVEHVARLEERRFDIRLIREQGRPVEGAAGTSAAGDGPIVVVFHAVRRPLRSSLVRAGERPPAAARG